MDPDESPDTAPVPDSSTPANQKGPDEDPRTAEPYAPDLPDSVATSIEGTGKAPVPPKKAPVPLMKVNCEALVRYG